MTTEPSYPTLGRNLLRAYAVICGIGSVALIFWAKSSGLHVPAALSPGTLLAPHSPAIGIGRGLGNGIANAYASGFAYGAGNADGARVRAIQLALIALSPILAALGCWAAGLALLDNSPQRNRMLGWFGSAHLLVLLALTFQTFALARRPMPVALSVTWNLTILLWSLERGRRAERSILGKLPAGIGRHEQEIRQSAAQQERNRLARDLHDSIKQQIFVIQTAAATAQTRFNSDRPGAETALDQIRDSARDAMTEMEAMLDQLRAVPLNNDGLVDAIRKQCEALELRTGAKVKFQLVELPPAGTLAPGAHEAILRVAQEALANIGRHARASHVTVSLDSFSDRVMLCIRDDGAGFNQFEVQRGMGMRNMRERAAEFGGKIDIVGKPGNGAQILLSIPHAEIPTHYRAPTYLYAAGLVIILIAAPLTWSGIWSILWVPPFIVCAIGLKRCIDDWRQAKKYTGATV